MAPCRPQWPLKQSRHSPSQGLCSLLPGRSLTPPTPVPPVSINRLTSSTSQGLNPVTFSVKLSFTHLIKTAGYLLPPNTNPYPLSRFIFLHSSSHHLIHYTFFTNFATVWKLHKNKDPCAVPPAPERVLCHTAKRSRLQRSGWRNGNLKEETGESRKSFWRSKSPRHSPTATPKYRPESVGASPSLSRHAHLGGAMAGSSATGGSRGRAGGLGPPPDLPRAHAPPTRKWVKGRRRRRRGWSSGAERAGKPQAL